MQSTKRVVTLLHRDVFNVVDRSADPTSARLTDGAVNDKMVNYVADRIADAAELARKLIVPMQHPPNLDADMESTERLGGLLQSYHRSA